MASADRENRRKFMIGRTQWFVEHVLPLEPKIRGWLRRAGWRREEIEDLIQETYARLVVRLEGSSAREIDHTSGYVFATTRSVIADKLRRERVVSIRSVADITRLSDLHGDSEASDTATCQEELERLRAVIDRLPPQCRAVFVLRKIEGLSQAQTAQRLGLSESTVEKHVARGMQLCAAWLTEVQTNDESPRISMRARLRARKR